MHSDKTLYITSTLIKTMIQEVIAPFLAVDVLVNVPLVWNLIINFDIQRKRLQLNPYGYQVSVVRRIIYE